MIDTEQRAADLCAAPAGCAFLLAVEESGLNPEEVAEPVAAAFLAALAVEAMSPWFGAHDRVVAMALGHGPRLLPLARDLLAQRAAAAWFAPLEREAQQWVCARDEAASPLADFRVRDRSGAGEREIEETNRRRWTSTELDPRGAMTSFLASVAFGVDDLGHYFQPPLAVYRLTVDPTARVFEIAEPQDWYRLCTRYPAAEDDGRLAPDWPSVAEDWDGVHLTLAGLLASQHVRVESAAGWSEHWGWDTEQTLWLRNVFIAIVRLPDITELAEPPDWLGEPRALHIEPGPDTWPWLVSLGPGTADDVVRWGGSFLEGGPPWPR